MWIIAPSWHLNNVANVFYYGNFRENSLLRLDIVNRPAKGTVAPTCLVSLRDLGVFKKHPLQVGLIIAPGFTRPPPDSDTQLERKIRSSAQGQKIRLISAEIFFGLGAAAFNSALVLIISALFLLKTIIVSSHFRVTILARQSKQQDELPPVQRRTFGLRFSTQFVAFS
jgi:hypothetical protein